MIGRVRSREVFRRFGREAARRRSGPVTIVEARGVSAASGSDVAEVAFAIPRRVGSAVVRNTLRRRLRAAMVELDRRSPIRPGAYLVIVHPQELEPSYQVLRAALSDGLERLGARQGIEL